MKRLCYSMLASFVLCSIVTACAKEKETTPVAKPDTNSIFSGMVLRTEPDEHGVVCYTIRYDTLSCVKVAP